MKLIKQLLRQRCDPRPGASKVSSDSRDPLDALQSLFSYEASLFLQSSTSLLYYVSMTARYDETMVVVGLALLCLFLKSRMAEECLLSLSSLLDSIIDFWHEWLSKGSIFS